MSNFSTYLYQIMNISQIVVCVVVWAVFLEVFECSSCCFVVCVNVRVFIEHSWNQVWLNVKNEMERKIYLVQYSFGSSSSFGFATFRQIKSVLSVFGVISFFAKVA